MKEENKLTKKESIILSLQELDITGPNQDQWTAGLVAPIVFTSVETFGLGSAHLLSLQPKVAFHLASMLSTWFRIYTGEAYACPCCPRRCWHRETWRLLIEACIYRLSSFLFSPSYCDSGRQATLARTVWHRRTGTFFLPWFIKSFFWGGAVQEEWSIWPGIWELTVQILPPLITWGKFIVYLNDNQNILNILKFSITEN